MLKYYVTMIPYTMKYRSRTDIIVSMLEAATHVATKTKIMYSSYLSPHPLRSYLELVIRNGLLAYDSTKQRSSTTARGLRLLELYNSIGTLELAPSSLTTSQK
jgi:predicted transcriptional regulator